MAVQVVNYWAIFKMSGEHVFIEHCLIYHDWSGRVKVALVFIWWRISLVPSFSGGNRALMALGHKLGLVAPNRIDLLLDPLTGYSSVFLLYVHRCYFRAVSLREL